MTEAESQLQVLEFLQAEIEWNSEKPYHQQIGLISGSIDGLLSWVEREGKPVSEHPEYRILMQESES